MTKSPALLITDAAAAFNPVVEYYRTFQYEMSEYQKHSLYISSTERIPQINFEKILDTMIAAASKKFLRKEMFLIVCHGAHNEMDFGLGLAMPLCANTTLKATVDVLEPLLDHLNKNTSAEDMAKYEKEQPLLYGNGYGGTTKKYYPKGSVARIVEKMRQLRQLKVRWVEFRACTLGNNPQALRVIGQCFSARFVSAPDVHQFYVKVIPGHPVTEQKFLKDINGRAWTRTFEGDGKFAMQMSSKGASRAPWVETTAKALRWFTDQYLWKDSYYADDMNGPKAFVINGMDHTSSKAFVMPQEKEYSDHIKWEGPLPGNMI
ncbi:MAG: hypothetical protein U0796_03685 [Gemmatales bacterium]